MAVSAQMDIRDLQQQLQQLRHERDGLLRRLDALTQRCDYGDETLSSQLLWKAEQQLADCRQELQTVRAERDGLLDDLSQVRSAKRTSDSGWRTEKQRLEELEKRFALFRSSMLQQGNPNSTSVGGSRSRSLGGGSTSSSTSASSNDRSAIELLLAKDSILRLEGELAAARTTARAEQNMRMDAERQLAAARQQLADLSRAMPQGLPHAPRDHQGVLLSAARSELLRAQVAAQQVKEQLQAARQQHEGQVAALRQELRGLHKELNDRSARVQDLELLVEQTSAALAVSQAAVKELQHVVTHGGNSDLIRPSDMQQVLQDLRLEVLQLQAQLGHYESQCDQGAAERQQLQQQLEAAREEAEGAQAVVAQVQEHANQLKLALAQAAREKVEALLQLSERLAAPELEVLGLSAGHEQLPVSHVHSPCTSSGSSPTASSHVVRQDSTGGAAQRLMQQALVSPSAAAVAAAALQYLPSALWRKLRPSSRAGSIAHEGLAEQCNGNHSLSRNGPHAEPTPNKPAHLQQAGDASQQLEQGAPLAPEASSGTAGALPHQQLWAAIRAAAPAAASSSAQPSQPSSAAAWMGGLEPADAQDTQQLMHCNGGGLAATVDSSTPPAVLLTVAGVGPPARLLPPSSGSIPKQGGPDVEAVPAAASSDPQSSGSSVDSSTAASSDASPIISGSSPRPQQLSTPIEDSTVGSTAASPRSPAASDKLAAAGPLQPQARQPRPGQPPIGDQLPVAAPQQQPLQSQASYKDGYAPCPGLVQARRSMLRAAQP